MPTVYVGVVVGVSMLRNAVDRGVAGDVVRRALEGEARALSVKVEDLKRELKLSSCIITYHETVIEKISKEN